MNGETKALMERLAHAENPFSSTFVRDIWETVYDTEALHHDASERLTKAYERVLAKGFSKGVVIMGAPGVGKSHLLNRFRRIVRCMGTGLVFQVRPLPGAARGWHAHFVRSVVSQLFITGRAVSVDAQAQFLRLLETLTPNLAALVDESGIVNKRAIKKVQEEYGAAKPSILSGIADPVAEEALRIIFFLLFYQWRLLGGSLPAATRTLHRNRAERCLKWLRGSPMDPEDKKSGEPKITRNLVGPDEMDESTTSYFTVLKVLGGMAGRGTPIVLIIDQIETISEVTASWFATAVHQLIDEVPGFLVITSGVTERIRDFVERRIFEQAAFDRMAELSLTLQPPRAKLYLEVIKDRVADLVIPEHRELPVKKSDFGVYFPFTKALVQRVTSEGDTVPTPREVMVMFRDLFENCRDKAAAQGEKWLRQWPQVEPLNQSPAEKPAPSATEVSARIREEFSSLQRTVKDELASHSDPAEDQEMAGYLEDILREVSDLEVRSDQDSAGCRSGAVRFVVDITLPEGIKSIGVVFDSRTDGSMVYNGLQRVKTHFDTVGTDPDMVCLVRDARAPFKESWKKSWERREELEGAGRLSVVALEEDSMVRLVALGRLLQAIKARDLRLEQGASRTHFVTVEDFQELVRAEGFMDSDPLLRRFRFESEPADPGLVHWVRSYLETRKFVGRDRLKVEAGKEAGAGLQGPELDTAFDRALTQLVEEGAVLVVDRIVKLTPRP